MSDLKFNPLSPLFNVCTMMMARIVWPQGYDLSETEAQDSLRRLRAEFKARERITVYSGSSDKTIFDCAGANQDFRAWHDWCHLKLDANFSLEGETRACNLQSEHIKARYGDGDTGRALIRMLEAEVIGQARYYQKFKEYVSDQRAFAQAYMVNEGHALCKRW